MATKSLRTEPQKRLYSLDALRGFDMFWITGGDELVVALAGGTWLGHQMHHADWIGFHFEDLIFPLFMFISGVAISFSVKSKLEKNVPKRKLFQKALLRLVVLFLLGMFYNGTFRNAYAYGRVPSVLGQIAIGYFFAATIVIYFKSFRSRIIWLVGILTGIGVLQLLVPVPGVGAGVLTREGCINGYIDRFLLDGRLYREMYDPEGLLCSISAVSVTLMGTIAGNILRYKKTNEWQKMGYMAGTGAGLVLLALALSTFYPIIKKCWTAPFDILTSGIGFLLLTLFYLIIDHWGFKKWAFYFRVIGMNSIFVYLFTRVIDVNRVSEFFLGWLAKPMGESGEVVIIIGGIALVWLLLYYMYKKKIFLRV